MAAIAITPVPTGFKFNEVAGNNGAIANSLTLKITGGTFAGDNGDVVNATIDNVPDGLNAVLVKTSATTAKLTLIGTAKEHANTNAINNLTVTFADENFATGGTAPDPITNLAVNFNDPAAAKTLALVAPDGAGTSETYNKDNLPTIKGTAPDGVAKVYIYNNGGTKPIGEAPVTGNAWTFKLPTEKLKDGAYSLTASASADGKGAMTAGFAFTVDQKAPSAPSVTAIKGAISDTTPVLSGKAEKFAKVEVFADEAQTKSLGTTYADAKGIWTLAVASDNTQLVKDDTYKITAKATDAAGNETKTKKAVDLTIDTKIDTPTLEATTVAKKNTVALKGEVKGETGGTLQLYGGEDGSVPLGKVIKIDKNGNWKSSVKLTDGKHLLSVVATDAAGNVSDNSVIDDKTTVTIDTFTATPTVELDKDGSGNVIGVKGTAEAGAKVKITIGKKTLEAEALADGTWSKSFDGFTPDSTTKAQTIKAVATDTATNVSKPSVAVTHTFVAATPDTTAPTYTSAAISGENKVVTLTFNEAVVSNVADLKAAVTFSADGTTFAALVAGDSVAIVDGKLVVTFAAALTGATNKIKVAADALKDAAGNKLATEVSTAAVSAVAAGDDTITGTDGAETLTGTANADTIDGLAGDDTITGGTGNDTLTGGAGNDTFNVDAGTDTITDLATGDILVVSADATAIADDVVAFVATAATTNDGTSATLNAAAAGGNISVALAGGTVGFNLIGGIGNDTLTGSALDDVINGGAGADDMDGGAGNDTFFVAEIADFAVGEVVAGGADTDILQFGAAGAITYVGRTVTGVETLDLTADATNAVVVTQGTGLTTVLGLGVVDATLTLNQGTTAFDAAAQANAAAVDVAGEWFYDGTGTNDGVLTYFDQTATAVVAITLTGVETDALAGGVANVDGNLVFTQA